MPVIAIQTIILLFVCLFVCFTVYPCVLFFFFHSFILSFLPFHSFLFISNNDFSAVNQVPPTAAMYWQMVAQLVKTRSAEECQRQIQNDKGSKRPKKKISQKIQGKSFTGEKDLFFFPFLSHIYIYYNKTALFFEK